MEVLCFFTGIAFAAYRSYYPLALFLIVLFFRPRYQFVLWFFVGFVWAVLHFIWIAGYGMPEKPLIKKAMLKGYVSSIVQTKNHKKQFYFQVQSLNDLPASAKILLSCYQKCPKIIVGEHAQVLAKIKRPKNMANPGGYDFERWLSVRHVSWVGSILPGTWVTDSGKNASYSLLRLRAYLLQRLKALRLDKQTQGILQALTLGISDEIEVQDWGLFRRTGTIHLMVISGAHIGLIAGITYWLSRRILRWFPGMNARLPAQKVASIIAIAMAAFYALIAGFAVPAQRALIVCIFMLARYFAKQRFSAWQAWRYALFIVLVIEPHSVLMPGFYLSFMAVAVLLAINRRFDFHRFSKVIMIQLGCLLGLLPFTLYWFSYAAINGLIANLIAIPWVGFVMVPLSLIILLTGQWPTFSFLKPLLSYASNSLIHFLTWVDTFSALNLEHTIVQPVIVFALLTAMVLLVFIPKRAMLLPAFILFIACFFPGFERLKNGEAVIDVLDVGQGLAIVVRTASHTLLYDTGTKLYRGSDMGEKVVIPYLKTIGTQAVDIIVVSHSDLDHRGGLPSIEKQYPGATLLVENPAFYHRGKNCHQQAPWEWDGVQFRFFALPYQLKGKNNHSCILQVKAKGLSMLLTGDIEKRAEQYLANHYQTAISSDALLIPHHLSKTSSSLAFLKAVNPKIALASYALDNMYHFPHQQAIQHYAALKIPIFDTASYGKIQLSMGQNKSLSVHCYSQRCHFN